MKKSTRRLFVLAGILAVLILAIGMISWREANVVYGEIEESGVVGGFLSLAMGILIVAVLVILFFVWFEGHG